MTREAWLTSAADLLRVGVFTEADAVVPPLRISVGWGRDGKAADGETDWSGRDRVPQVFVSPRFDAPADALVIVVHELVHCALGADEDGDHARPFKALARSVGLRAPFRQAWATPLLSLYLAQVAEALGPYPHTRLDF